MNKYKQIQNRYRAIGLDKDNYTISKKEHMMVVFGVDIDEDIKGLELLNSDERKFVIEKGVYGLLNSGGLEWREKFIVNKVEKIGYKFKLWTEDGYSWLYPDGCIG